MYDVLADTLRRAESGTHAGYAVINECVRTIATVYPNTRCIELAAKSIARFLSSGNNNLRYLGITALTQIVQVGLKNINIYQESSFSLKANCTSFEPH